MKMNVISVTPIKIGIEMTNRLRIYLSIVAFPVRARPHPALRATLSQYWERVRMRDMLSSPQDWERSWGEGNNLLPVGRGDLFDVPLVRSVPDIDERIAVLDPG